jgi:hypothetical protein
MNKAQTFLNESSVQAEGLRLWIYHETEDKPWRAVLEYRQEKLEFTNALELVKYLEDLQHTVKQLKGIR